MKSFFIEALFRKTLISFISSGRGEDHRATKLPRSFPAGAGVFFPSSCSLLVYLATGAPGSTIQVVKRVFVMLENHPEHCFQQLKLQQKLLGYQGAISAAGCYKQPPVSKKLGRLLGQKGVWGMYLSQNV